MSTTKQCPGCNQQTFTPLCDDCSAGATDQITRAFRKTHGDRFTVERLLGAGAMGVVFRVFDASFKQWIAVKTVQEKLAPTVQLDRVREEARSILRASHENNVKVLEVETIGEIPYIRMGYVHGRSLSDAMTNRAPVDVALHLVRQGARAITAAHKARVIHRDIKPSNMMINDDGDLIVIDYGLALNSDSPFLTGNGMAVGTRFYMAQEIKFGLPANEASDKFAFGVVAYKLLSGRYPFSKEDYSHLAIPQHLRELDVEIPERVADAVMSMIKRLPADRLVGLKEFAEMIDSELRERRVQEEKIREDTRAFGRIDELPALPAFPTPNAMDRHVSGVSTPIVVQDVPAQLPLADYNEPAQLRAVEKARNVDKAMAPAPRGGVPWGQRMFAVVVIAAVAVPIVRDVGRDAPDDHIEQPPVSDTGSVRDSTPPPPPERLVADTMPVADSLRTAREELAESKSSVAAAWPAYDSVRKNLAGFIKTRDSTRDQAAADSLKAKQSLHDLRVAQSAHSTASHHAERAEGAEKTSAESTMFEATKRLNTATGENGNAVNNRGNSGPAAAKAQRILSYNEAQIQPILDDFTQKAQRLHDDSVAVNKLKASLRQLRNKRSSRPADA